MQLDRHYLHFLGLKAWLLHMPDSTRVSSGIYSTIIMMMQAKLQFGRLTALRAVRRAVKTSALCSAATATAASLPRRLLSGECLACVLVWAIALACLSCVASFSVPLHFERPTHSLLPPPHRIDRQGLCCGFEMLSHEQEVQFRTKEARTGTRSVFHEPTVRHGICLMRQYVNPFTS